MAKVKVWDPVVRAFHWSLVAGFTANAIFTDAEGKLHEIVGYAVVALIGLRILWGLTGTRHARFADFPPSLSGAIRQMREMATGRRHAHIGHSPLGALMIYNLMASILVIGLTGYMMTTLTWFGVGWVEELHEVAVTWAELSIAAHIAAVIFESRRLGINLPKSMLTGYKSMPEAGDKG
ncbi:cytochrome b/b6 domain-containing protein [Defluviimonas sp. SAOS-178_SWC]|uniref:cytochrome b/b6 domain-containing protein n=1 Tax=Defluviimonas sp. SAOS-178_SWC TaxID=3121287 RepID=UPI003221A67D